MESIILDIASAPENLTITVGQFISVAIFVVTIMTGLTGWLIKLLTSINSVRLKIVELEGKTKALEDNRNENRHDLNEIKDSLNQIYTKVEILISKSKGNHRDVQ